MPLLTLSKMRAVAHEGHMIRSSSFERFVKYSLISVMTRALMEAAIRPDDLDGKFDAHAERQCTRSLTFSTIVELMEVVVRKRTKYVDRMHVSMARLLAAAKTRKKSH